MSGTKNDQGKAPIHFITREFMEGLARAQGFGAKKYGDYNFTKGIAYTRLLDAAMRHILAFTWGEDNDIESGESHISHAAANLNMLMFMVKNHPELDDRYKKETIIQDLKYPYTENNSSVPSGRSRGRKLIDPEFAEIMDSYNQMVLEKYKDPVVTNILNDLNKETPEFFGLNKEEFLKFKDNK